MFSGSYRSDDVTFLLKRIQMTSTSVQEKEKNIQKGVSHYSEMITYEKAPTDQYMEIFHKSLKRNGQKFAEHIWLLAQQIMKDYELQKEIVIVSLARAGTPVGVLLNRVIRNENRQVSHYSVSIIRDKGLDENAMKFILSKHQDSEIVFVDGWTGKGVIGQELKQSIDKLNQELKTNISSHLYVVADISGTAHWAATHEDYLLPSAVLNSTVSGLVSRTILNSQYIATDDFHGCVYYDNLQSSDISNWFVQEIEKIINLYKNSYYLKEKPEQKEMINRKNHDTIHRFMKMYDMDNRNFIKPGVGESTRVLLRRVPKIIWLKDENDVCVEHLKFLAMSKGIEIKVDPQLSYNAIAVIEEMD